jgi:hypothetical protein
MIPSAASPIPVTPMTNGDPLFRPESSTGPKLFDRVSGYQMKRQYRAKDLMHFICIDQYVSTDPAASRRSGPKSGIG